MNAWRVTGHQTVITYGEFDTPKRPGAMTGAQEARIIDKATGVTLRWQYETYDSVGNVRSIGRSGVPFAGRITSLMLTATCLGGALVADLPDIGEVRHWLRRLADAGYSTEARHRASDWATPFLVEAPAPLITDPPVLGKALFLLGAADLLGDFEHYVYAPADFDEVRAQLAPQP